MLDPNVQEWFEEFSNQIRREGDLDRSALYIDLNRPEDRARIFSVNAATTTGVEPVLPSSGEISDEDKNRLYEQAKAGNLFIFSLGAPETPVQITAEKDNILHLFPDEEREIEEPVCGKLGFFKNLLHALFGFFEEELQGYQREYEIARTQYTYDLGMVKFYEAKNQHWKSFSNWRNEQIRDYSEPWRRGGREMLEKTVVHLQDPSLPAWSRAAYQVRERLLRGLVEGGTHFTKEESREMLATLIVERLLSKKKPLLDQVTEKPERLQQLLNIASKSIAVEEMLNKSDASINGSIVNCAFSGMAMDNLSEVYSLEVKDRIAVANLLHKVNKRGPVDNSIAGLKDIFEDEAVTQWMIQLRNARKRIPQEQLKAVSKYKENGVIKEVEYFMFRKDVALDDERVLNVYKQDQAERDGMNKADAMSGPVATENRSRQNPPLR